MLHLLFHLQSVLEDAYTAWELSQPSEIPFEAQPSEEACGFCDYKAWCAHWWNWRHSGKSPPQRMFVDAVVLIERADVTEEIVRANIHLDNFIQYLKYDDPVGKRLNFLIFLAYYN